MIIQAVNCYLGSTVLPPDDIPGSGDFTITLGNITTSNGSESLLMIAPIGNPSGDAVKGLLRTLPAGDFSVVVGVRGFHVQDTNNMGILFRDTAGKYICIGNVHVAGTISSGITQHNTAGTGGYASLLAGSRAHGSSNCPLWLKATFTASSNDVEGFYSYTGDNWVSVGTSTFLGTADAVGIGVGHDVFSSSSVDQHAWFFHFEVQ